MISQGVLTPSHLLEYLYCPRFIYFEYVLGIPERQEKRFKVKKGREIDEHRKKVNPKYLRKKLGVIRREIDVELNCPELNVRGKADEILWLQDGTMAPFDYKYAEYKDRLWRTHKIQAALYAMMIRHIYKADVRKGLFCFIRSKHRIVEMEMTEKLFADARSSVESCLEVIQAGTYPKATSYRERCSDCTYNNICAR